MTPSLRTRLKLALATLAAALVVNGAWTQATMDEERDGSATQINAVTSSDLDLRVSEAPFGSKARERSSAKQPQIAAPYSSYTTWLVQCMNGGSFSWIDANGDLNTTICSTTRIISPIQTAEEN